MKLLQGDYAYLFLGGFYLSMSIFHLIVYFFNQGKKANLVYGVGLGLSFINFTFIDFTSTASTFSASSHKASVLINLLTNAALLSFIYFFLATSSRWMVQTLRVFAAIYGLCILVLVVPEDLTTAFPQAIIALTRFMTYAGVITVSVFGIYKRIPNFYLIILATLGLALTEAFVAVDVFDVWRQAPASRLVLLILGYTLPFLFYSTYLAKDLAVTSKKLSEEHQVNARLSREKYEQELINSELLEKQKDELEVTVEQRTREILNQRDELERQAETIRELDRSRSNFFGNISHEFRTPLTLILGPVTQKLETSTNEEERRDLGLIRDNALKLLNLVNQLLDLSRSENGIMRLNLLKGELVSFVRQSVNGFQGFAKANGLKFQMLTEQDAIPLFFDHDKLEKVLSNLVSNAFKFTSAGGLVRVEVRSTVDSAEIAVVDTGTGIREDQLTRIFERYYQVQDTSGGSGIGLALTKEFVELHGGNIRVKSEPGAGSTFTITLPLQPADLSSRDDKLISAGEPLPALLETAGRETILVVEDEDELRKFIADVFSARYHVLQAANGKQGFAYCQAFVPDLVITDVLMPEVNGIDMCRMIRENENTSHIPLIMLTARADQQAKLEGLVTGADDYILKPFETTELRIRAENLIRSREYLKKKFSAGVYRLQPSSEESMEDRFMKKVMAIIEEQLSNNKFGVELFASQAGMSTIQLYRKLKALTGLTPNDFIRDCRLQRAAELFQKRTGNVSEIAYRTGFNNLSYFTKCFKEKYGVTPSEYGKS